MAGRSACRPRRSVFQGLVDHPAGNKQLCNWLRCPACYTPAAPGARQPASLPDSSALVTQSWQRSPGQSQRARAGSSIRLALPSSKMGLMLGIADRHHTTGSKAPEHCSYFD